MTILKNKKTYIFFQVFSIILLFITLSVFILKRSFNIVYSYSFLPVIFYVLLLLGIVINIIILNQCNLFFYIVVLISTFFSIIISNSFFPMIMSIVFLVALTTVKRHKTSKIIGIILYSILTFILVFGFIWANFLDQAVPKVIKTEEFVSPDKQYVLKALKYDDGSLSVDKFKNIHYDLLGLVELESKSKGSVFHLWEADEEISLYWKDNSTVIINGQNIIVYE